MGMTVKSSLAKTNVPWKRFWCRAKKGSNFSAHGDGFLPDPETSFWNSGGKTFQEIDVLVPLSGPLILCGEPGIGKTTEIEKLSSKIASEIGVNHAIITLNFRLQIGDMADFRRLTVDSAKWTKWRDGSGFMTLIIDGVDEGLLRIANFVGLLTGHLRDEPVDRLKLILACRSANWPTGLGNDLIALWRQDATENPVYEMCPLREVDAKLAARHYGYDEEHFINQLIEMRLEGLAARPVTLFMLIDGYQREHKFPATHRELYEKSTAKLSNEIDAKRVEIIKSYYGTTTWPKPKELLDASKRIATLLLCCGKSTVGPGDYELSAPESHLFSSGCSSTHDVHLTSAIDHVLESALFKLVAEKQFSFAHQTFAECLAAQALGKMPLIQVRRLLLQGDEEGEHLIPQLSEVSAWTAGYHAEFRELLLNIDPVSILRSDVALLDSQDKHQIIDSLLRKSESGELIDPYSLYRFLPGLAHVAIEDQLRPYVIKPKYSLGRRIALAIVEKCRLHGFKQDLFAILKSSTDPMHEDAAKTLCAIVPDSELHELEPLARGEYGPDPDDEILGAVLQRLVPKHWRVRDALPFIGPRSNHSFIGEYQGFLLNDFQAILEKADIVTGLKWVSAERGCLSESSSRHKLSMAIVNKSLECLDDTEVSRSFVELWFQLAIELQLGVLLGNQAVQQFLTEQKQWKRKIVRDLVEASHDHQVYDAYTIFYDRVPFDSSDFGWLLDEIKVSKSTYRQAWGSLIERCLVLGDVWMEFCEEIINLSNTIQELKGCSRWLNPWSLDDPNVIEVRTQWKKSKDAQFGMFKQRNVIDNKSLRDAAIKKARAGDDMGWYALWECLILNEGDPSLRYWNLVVWEFPGWQCLLNEEQSLAMSAALKFVIQFSEKCESWETNDYRVLAGVSAIWMLKEQIGTNDELRFSIIHGWIMHCVSIRTLDQVMPKEIFAFFYRFDPDATINAYFGDHGGIHRDVMGLKRASNCWDSNLDSATAAYMNHNYENPNISGFLQDWFALGKSAATKFAKAYLHIISSFTERCLVSTPSIIGVCLLGDFRLFFDVCIDILDRDKPLARQVWPVVFYARYTTSDRLVGDLTEEQVALLIIHLNEAFPRSEYPHSQGQGFVSSIDAVIDARARLPSILSSRGSTESCLRLKLLIDSLPEEASNMRFHYHQSLLNRRRNTWSIPDVEAVVRLIEDGAKRLLNSEDDLLDLVSESLNRYQHSLTEDTQPEVENLWNEVIGSRAGKGKRMPKDETVVSRSIARWLTRDLGPLSGVVANCEVKPRKGSSTDIYVETFRDAAGGDKQKMTIVIEVKKCSHVEAATAMHSQLVEGYLRPNGLKTGIYVIAWFADGRCLLPSPDGNLTLEGARLWLNDEVSQYDGKKSPLIVRGIVLDCQWPNQAPSQSKRKAKVGSTKKKIAGKRKREAREK